MAGGVVAGARGLGNDADVSGLDGKGDDFAAEFVVAGLLEVPMVAMGILLDLCFRARTIAASMAIEGLEAIDAASLATAASAEDGSQTTFLLREE